MGNSLIRLFVFLGLTLALLNSVPAGAQVTESTPEIKSRYSFNVSLEADAIVRGITDRWSELGLEHDESQLIDFATRNRSARSSSGYGFGAMIYECSLGQSSSLTVTTFEGKLLGFNIMVLNDSVVVKEVVDSWNRLHPERPMAIQKYDGLSGVGRSRGLKGTVTGVDSKQLSRYSDHIIRALNAQAFQDHDSVTARYTQYDHNSVRVYGSLERTAYVKGLGTTRDVYRLFQLMSGSNPSVRMEAAIELEKLKMQKVVLPKHVKQALRKVKDPKVSVCMTNGCFPSWGTADKFIVAFAREQLRTY